MPPRARKVLGTEEDEATAAFADTEGVALSWSIAEIPKPWKNPLWQRDTSKRTKNIKQVMGLERDRSAVHPPGPSRVHPKLAKAPQDPEAEAKLEPEEQEKALAVRQALDTEGKPVMPMANYFAIEAPPSLLPNKKYCDVTGLPTPYTEPKSQLHYANAEVFELVKTLPHSTQQGYLAVRGSGLVLR